MKMTQKMNWIKLILCAMFVCMAHVVSAQQVAVRGQVLDAGTKEPMIGVSVLEKGTTNGTITDFDGNYSLNVASGKTLVFSYIGYVTQEIVVSGETVNVSMKEDSKTLSEVVVVGYGVQKKSSVTGAISQVKTEDLENRSVANPQAALQGKTAGVQIISSSAAPGSSPTVRVRGFSSNVSSNPLYVVDGVRLSDISGLDPNDIASIEVLKDAASAAIYGAEAGNGVVLISTKKGTKGQGKINYDFQYTIQSVGKIPELLNAQEYKNYMMEGNVYDASKFANDWDGVTDTNWADVVFGTGIIQKHNLSFSNGNDKGNYYLSLSYLDNDGIVKGDADFYKRLTGSINADYQIKDWLKVGTTNQIEKYNYRQLSQNNAYGSFFQAVMELDPLTPDTYAPGNLPDNMVAAMNNGQTLLTDENGNYYAVSKFVESENYHPMIMRDNTVPKNSGFNVNGSVYGELKPLDGLVITSRFGYRLSGTRSSTTNLPFYGNSVQNNNFISQSGTSSTTIYWQWENFANYIKTFNEHTLTAMIGMSYQESTYDYITAGYSANGADALLGRDPSFWYLSYGSPSASKSITGEKTRTAKYSYFGRIGYDFAGKYMLQASLRADAADLAYLPASGRWGFFPAVSAGWTISEENFFEPLKDVVSNLKLRASWGQNGSLAALGGYAYGTTMNNSGYYPFVPGNTYITAVRPNSLGNDDLKWETSEQLNIGLDARLFNDRLTFSVDWFNKKTKDLLVTGTTPSLIIGGTTSPINAGNVSNKGFEFELGWRDNIGDFNYSIKGNLATLKNEVTYLDPSLTRLPGTTFHTSTITYFEEGYPVYYFRGYEYEGVDSETGEPIFADVDGDGTVNENDKTYIGDAIPDFTYGITLTAAWKGLDLTVFGSGSYGNDIFNCATRSDHISANKMKKFFYDDRWTPEHTQASVPRANATSMDKYLVSDAMVFDGSYFKIKQIQLGYTLPKAWTKKAFIQNMRLYVSLEDFFTFTKYDGFDPEASASDTSGMGIDMGTYPTSKKVMLGFNVEF